MKLLKMEVLRILPKTFLFDTVFWRNCQEQNFCEQIFADKIFISIFIGIRYFLRAFPQIFLLLPYGERETGTDKERKRRAGIDFRGREMSTGTSLTCHSTLAFLRTKFSGQIFADKFLADICRGFK